MTQHTMTLVRTGGWNGHRATSTVYACTCGLRITGRDAMAASRRATTHVEAANTPHTHQLGGRWKHAGQWMRSCKVCGTHITEEA